MNKRCKEIEKIITPSIKEMCPYIDVVIVRYYGKREHFGRKPYEVLLGIDMDNLGKFKPYEVTQYVKTLGKYILLDEEWFINVPLYDKSNYHPVK
jgi:hypothetical protein